MQFPANFLEKNWITRKQGPVRKNPERPKTSQITVRVWRDDWWGPGAPHQPLEGQIVGRAREKQHPVHLRPHVSYWEVRDPLGRLQWNFQQNIWNSTGVIQKIVIFLSNLNTRYLVNRCRQKHAWTTTRCLVAVSHHPVHFFWICRKNYFCSKTFRLPPVADRGISFWTKQAPLFM